MIGQTKAASVTCRYKPGQMGYHISLRYLTVFLQKYWSTWKVNIRELKKRYYLERRRVLCCIMWLDKIDFASLPQTRLFSQKWLPVMSSSLNKSSGLSPPYSGSGVSAAAAAAAASSSSPSFISTNASSSARAPGGGGGGGIAAIIYALIARGSVILVEHTESSGNFTQVTQSLLERGISDGKMTYVYDK